MSSTIFVSLGVTAIELMPIQSFVDDRFLQDKGLRNYWGYSTLNFFAPEPRYLGPDGFYGLRAAIRSLHDAGIEVLMDVVYNHTCEGSHLGPTISFRGIDNASYYKLPEGNRASRRIRPAPATRSTCIIPASCRWCSIPFATGSSISTSMVSVSTSPPRSHAILIDVDERAGFLRAVGQDPVLSKVKLIAEPWDLGDAGYRLGGFPAGWSEWNDRFRDSVRGFWRGDPGQLAGLARALTGSREIFGHRGRAPGASIHYIASHDGFTLADLVSYNERHNEANGEDNRDGHPHNLSWNCGVEGPSDDRDVLRLRKRQKRNLIASVLLSLGVPMLLMGDEFSRTQGGNNNAYAQDNETSWLDWEESAKDDPSFAEFVRALAQLRRESPALARPLLSERRRPARNRTEGCLLAVA